MTRHLWTRLVLSLAVGCLMASYLPAATLFQENFDALPLMENVQELRLNDDPRDCGLVAERSRMVGPSTTPA